MHVAAGKITPHRKSHRPGKGLESAGTTWHEGTT
jgi:hypothetical protein